MKQSKHENRKSFAKCPGTVRHVLTLTHKNKKPKYRQLVTGQIIVSKP